MSFYYYNGIRYNQNGQAVYDVDSQGDSQVKKLVEEIENIITQVKTEPKIVSAPLEVAETTKPEDKKIKQSTKKNKIHTNFIW